jgi:hypothetical protein
MVRALFILFVLSLVLVAAACKNGGGGSTPQVDAINIDPGTPAAGSLVQVTGQVSGTGASSATKSWSVSAGSISLSPPDFGLILRGTAKAGSATSLDTTASTVYWLAPASGGSATLTLTIGTSTKTRTVTLGNSPVTLTVADSGANKQVTIAAANVTDLYQAAFRVTYSSAWQPTSVSQGDFLGAPVDTVFFEMHDRNGFVPVAVSRKGGAAGVDGSGTLAVITFAPSGGTSSARDASAVPFDLDLVVLRTSTDEPINF